MAITPSFFEESYTYKLLQEMYGDALFSKLFSDQSDVIPRLKREPFLELSSEYASKRQKGPPRHTEIITTQHFVVVKDMTWDKVTLD